MKLNNIEFGADLQAMMNHALVIAKELGKANGINFKGSKSDSINLLLEKGELSHLWVHAKHNGQLFRCAFTETEGRLYVWTDKQGWKPYASAKRKIKSSRDMLSFTRTGKRVFCTTLGWDGKDYDGVGRYLPEWKRTGELESEDTKTASFIRIYDFHHKCFCFLKVTDKMSKAGAPEAEYYSSKD